MMFNNFCKISKIYISILVFLLVFSGCLVRTYTVVKERPDQEVAGNQGYLLGDSPEPKEKEVKTRKTYFLEIELGRKASAKEAAVDKDGMGAVDELSPEIVAGEPDYAFQEQEAYSSLDAVPQEEAKKWDTYIVKKGDTLEKIAGRSEIYGNKKKWYRIYKANRGKLKSPDKISPGQVLQIPR